MTSISALRALSSAIDPVIAAVLTRVGGGDAHIVRALLLGALVSIRDRNTLCGLLGTRREWRWFAGLGRAEVLTPSQLRRGRARLFATGAAPLVFARILEDRRCARLILDPGLRVDVGQLEAWGRHATMSAGDSPPAPLGSVLLLPRMSDAWPFLPYLERHGHDTALEIAVRRLRAGLDASFVITAYSAATAAAMQPAAARCGARVLTLLPRSQLTQLLDVASQLHVANLAVLEPDAALMAPESLRDLWRRHERQANDITFASAKADSSSAAIYRVPALHDMRVDAPRRLDASPREWFAWSRRRQAHRVLFQFHASALPPAGRSTAQPPYAIKTVDDWQRLASAIGQAGGAAAGRWRRAAHPRAEAVRPRMVPAARGRGPRVLFVTPSRAFAGPERMYVRLATGLIDRGVDLWGLLARGGLISSLLRPRDRRRFIAEGVEFEEPGTRSSRYVRQVLRDVSPDVVHCNGIPDEPVLDAATAASIPIVAHVRIAELGGAERALASAARLIAVSDFIRAELVRAGADAARIRVSHDGLDANAFVRDPRGGQRLRMELGVGRDDTLIVSVARCSRSKRIETVIEAMAAARVRHRAHLLIVGEIEEPAYFEFLLDRLAQHAMQSTTHMRHAVENMGAVFGAADAMVLASVRDPLPNAVLEAMASGTPVVASASGGIPEMIDETTGTLVDPDSIDGFARALRRVYRRDPELVTKARRGRFVARRRFALADHVDDVHTIYLDVAGR